VVDPEWRFCPDCGTNLGLGGHLTDPAGAPRLADHIPAVLAERIRSAGVGRGERKQVTVFFCDLVGSTSIAEDLDPEVYREVLDRYLELAFAEVHAMEGIVNQLAGDGFMALFGAPLAHEDDPVRAVRAALAAQQELAKLSERTLAEQGFALQARIGIHTGMVVVGTVGNDLKMDYTAIGDTTNLAARLQALAEPGAILVSATTERLIRGPVQTEPVGPFEIKGRRDPVPAYRILGWARRTRMAIVQERGLTPFVGREEELAQLEACYRRLEGGQGQLVSIIGDAGTGKSRLVYEFKQRIEAEEVTLFEARCSSLLQRMPYGVWVRMLERHVGIDPDESAENKTRKLEQVLGSAGVPNMPYLRSMLGIVPAAELDTAREMSKEQSFDAFEQVIMRSARSGPVVLIIEELHWIDESSLDMLKTAAGRLHMGGVMLLVTQRSDFESPLRTRAAETRLRLSPFNAPDGRAILRAVAGGRPPRELERRILEKAEGNPFYIEELTRALIAEGTLAPSEDGWLVTTRPVSEIAIPDTVQELLAARLDRLPSAAKRVAQLCAVLGREFRREQLGVLFEQEWIDPDAELAELERQGILHRKGGLSDSVYRFGESLTQSVAYESLLISERRALHARIARLFEERGEVADQALVAHHWARSDQRERGVESLLAAAHQAEELPAYAEALRLYQEAWSLADELLSDSADAAPKLVAAAIEAARGLTQIAAIHGASSSEQVERAALRGQELALRSGDTGRVALLQGFRGLLLMSTDRARYAEGLGLLESAVGMAEEAQLEHLMLRIGRPLTLAYLLDGRFADARHMIAEIIARLEKLGEHEEPTDTYLVARFFEARILLEADALEEGERLARWCHERASALGNRTVTSGTAALIAESLLRRALYDEADNWARIAIDIGAEIGNRAVELVGHAARVIVCARRGERPATRDIDAFEQATYLDANVAGNLDLVVEALLDAGQVDAALAYAELNMQRAGGQLREALAGVQLARALLASPGADHARARSLLAAAARWAESFGSRTTRAHALLELASLEQNAEMRQEAQRIFEELGLQRYAQRAVSSGLAAAPASLTPR
jgi:class 3 adenylate cyclase